MLERDFEFSCPHCGVALTLCIDPTGGRKQDFVQDCDICCRPIHITLTLEHTRILDFQAERES